MMRGMLMPDASVTRRESPPVALASGAMTSGVEVTSTTDVLAPITNATGGDSRRVTDANGIDLPRILAVRSSDTYKGDDWLGVRMRDASVVRGIGVLPMFAGLLGLLLLIGSMAATWAREGR